MKFSEVRQKFEDCMTAAPSLKSFMFDDLVGINKDREKEYPVLLWKIPKSNYADANLEYSIYEIDFFVFDLERQDDDRALDLIMEDCENNGIAVIREVLKDRPNLGPAESPIKVNITRGHVQHNAKTVGVRFEFKLKVFNGC